MNTITELSTYELEKSLVSAHEFVYKGVKFVDIKYFCTESYYKTCEICYNYSIIPNFKHSDVKKIYFNEFLTNICNYVIKDQFKVIFCYNETEKFNEYDSVSRYIINKIQKLLPVTFFYYNVPFSDLINKIAEEDICIMSDVEESLFRLYQFKNFNFSFNKMKQFLKKNKLTFLENVYFNLQQVKLALLT